MVFLFKAKTREAIIIKILGEYFSKSLKHPPFTVNEGGIYLLASNSERHILNDLELSHENFMSFVCKKPLNFSVNSLHFYSTLKSIKKKDTVTLFITEESPMELGVKVEHDGNPDTTYVKIIHIQPEIIDKPEGYEQMLCTPHKEFQKVKSLGGVSKDMEIKIKGNNIKFYCDGNKIVKREISIGKVIDEDDEETEESSLKEYSQSFHTQYVTQLTKCAGQAGGPSGQGTIQIYYHEELPLKIKMKLGMLGLLNIYIKSKELIQLDDEDGNDKDEDKDEEDD